MLSVPGRPGEALLDATAARFWTEHSDRCGLNSWHACLGTDKSERSFLGRWGVKGSTDTYVRTAVRIVERLQCQGALAAIKSHGGGADSLGEEQTLRDLGVYMRKFDSDDKQL